MIVHSSYKTTAAVLQTAVLEYSGICVVLLLLLLYNPA